MLALEVVVAVAAGEALVKVVVAVVVVEVVVVVVVTGTANKPTQRWLSLSPDLPFAKNTTKRVSLVVLCLEVEVADTVVVVDDATAAVAAATAGAA
jgi:hypothetical protein